VSVLGPTLRYLLPVAVTAYLLSTLLGQYGDALDLITLDALLRLAPIMILYGIVSLGIDAVSLNMLARQAGCPSDLATCGRIKAASYALAIINYALGAAALIVLFRRRLGLTLQGSSGIVGTSAVTDLAMLFVVTATAAALAGGEGPSLEPWLAALVIVGTLGGVLVLRAPFSLGPMDRLRDLEIFQVLRTAAPSMLVQLAAIRVAVVLVFIGMGGGALWAFRIDVPIAETIVGMSAISLVGAVPIAFAGLGTVQVAAVELFDTWADASALVAASLAMQASMIFVRGATALMFAREFTAEAVAASRGGES
jgi:hypothetical protein